jgi:Xaa-Pro aminopeptidase
MHLNTFNKEVYIRRRKQLSETMQKGLLLFMGNEESSMNYRDNWYPFRQDSSFLYYFGLDLSGLVALIDLDNNREIIFGNELSIDDIIWTGPQPGLQELADAVGVQQSSPLAQLVTYLQQAEQKRQTIHILPPYRPENKIRLASWLNSTIPAIDQYISVPFIKAVISQREIKEEIELEEMHKACSISADMHMAVIRSAKPGMKEYELAAMAEAIALSNWGRLSYTTILSVDGQILHNHYYGNTIREEQMILCDAGAETNRHYAGDLTRTTPSGKRFTGRQEELYNTVLAAMDHAVSLLKPGITFREVHTQACIQLMSGLKQVGLVKGDPEEAVANDVHTLFFQCGLGHMIGLDVHDMEDLGEEYVGYSDELKKGTSFGWKSLRLGKTLQAGFTLTVEPGIYIIPELIDKWKAVNKLDAFIDYKLLEKFRDFGGIRIEDNYVITGTGSEKLGKQLPKTLADLYAARG